MKKPAVLIIMDGYGIAPKSEGNAVWLAATDNGSGNYTSIFEVCPTVRWATARLVIPIWEQEELFIRT